jgi:hypothetical protein
MTFNNLESTRLNAERSLLLASPLFPYKEWKPHGEGIFIAKSRFSGGHKEQAKLYREIADARILTGWGSAAYFLPERPKNEETTSEEEIHSMHPDTVIDGVIVEIKPYQAIGQLWGNLSGAAINRGIHYSKTWNNRRTLGFSSGVYPIFC